MFCSLAQPTDISISHCQVKISTHRIRKPAVGDERPLLLHTHHLSHVLKARVVWHLIIERRLVLFHDTCREIKMVKKTKPRSGRLL